jgi:hypothetical protein
MKMCEKLIMCNNVDNVSMAIIMAKIIIMKISIPENNENGCSNDNET